MAFIQDTDLVLLIETYHDPVLKWAWKKVIFRDMIGWICGTLVEYKHG